MRLSLDPPVIAPRNVTAESLALEKWYDANPTIRRLWGIQDVKTLRVVVALEPTHDGDDVYPAWAANYPAWARDLRSLTRSVVQLELFSESSLDGIECHPESIVVADVFWRDATLIPPEASNTEDDLATTEQSGKSTGLSDDQILAAIGELHECYDYCAAWKETTPDAEAGDADVST